MDGKISIDGATRLTHGTARRIKIHADPRKAAKNLADNFNVMACEHAVVLGDLVQPHNEVKIVTKSELLKHTDSDVLIISRSKDYITYHAKQPAWALFDIDAKNLRADLPLEDVFEALCSVIPELKNAARVVRTSSSSGITTPKTGKKFDSGGLHIFVLVEDGAEIDRATLAFDKHLWLAGFVKIVFSANGAPLIRSPIDTAVRSPERLVCAGAVECVAPIIVDPNAGLAVAAGSKLLDTTNAISNLNDGDMVEYKRLGKVAKNVAQPESEKKREDYISKRAGALANASGVSQT
ncbi:MAG: hypothetical protein QMC11_06990 [Rhodospirillales bacterium]